MRFLADMGVSQLVVEWLRANGHESVHLRDEGLQRLPNGEIFQKAGREQRIVLTFDLDFGEILAGSRGQIVSVVLFRLRNTRTNFVIQRLDEVLNLSSAELSRWAIVIVEDGRHRVRSLPIGS
jgi:predicted nuclease of predicted toxin-antitoxin system